MAPDIARTMSAVKIAALRFLNRHPIQPSSRPAGRNKPASENPREVEFMAVDPPPRGELVSMVSCTVDDPFAFNATVSLSKWQVTPMGRVPQPSPMVSAKPLLDLNVMEMVVFCVDARVTLSGLMVMPKPVGVPDIWMADEVEAPCTESPLYWAVML